MILLWYILIPAVAAPLAWLLGRRQPLAARWIAVAGTAAPLMLLVAQWVTKAGPLTNVLVWHTGGAAGLSPATLVQSTWLVHLKVPWIAPLGIDFFLAEDGLTVIMLALTFALGLLAVLASWRGIGERVGFFHFMILWTTAALAGVFLSLDLFLFYFFFEMMLIPMYFIIALWGHERRVYAAVKFFIFTQVSGLLMLIAILALYFIHGRASGTYTFDFPALLGTKMSSGTAFLLMLGFFAAFAVKLPAFPFHSWLPDAHTEAPTAGSVILAGVLIKIGAYGMIRFMIPLFPQAAYQFRTAALVLGVIGIIYGAIMAYAQTDMKRLVAYTSVSHMGFVLIGIFAWNTLALQGVVLQLVCHALSTGALFILVGGLQDRIHTRDMGRMGGLWTIAPRMGGTAMFFALASLGLPGLGNFVAEFLILVGTWQVAKWAAVLGAVGLVFAAVYALWMMQRAFQGEETHGWKIGDLVPRETVMFAAMIAALVAIGFYPQPLIATARQTVTAVQQLTAGSSLTAGPATAARGAPAPSGAIAQADAAGGAAAAGGAGSSGQPDAAESGRGAAP
jgi:NADH-quinone oxidoreductase subunit M